MRSVHVMSTARRILWLVTVAVLGVVLLGFWWRSGRTMDEWSLVTEDNTLYAAVSFRGGVHLIRAEANSTRRALNWDAQPVLGRTTYRELHLGRDVLWERLGFAQLRYIPPPPPRPVGGRLVRVKTNPPPLSLAPAPWLLTQPYDAWVIPYWALFAVLVAAPLTFESFHAVRRWHRRRKGRCLACGYDLRESQGRCPECGDAGKGGKARPGGRADTEADAERGPGNPLTPAAGTDPAARSLG